MKIKNNNIFVEYNELISSEIEVFSNISGTYELIKTIRAKKLFKEIRELDIIKNIMTSEQLQRFDLDEYKIEKWLVDDYTEMFIYQVIE